VTSAAAPRSCPVPAQPLKLTVDNLIHEMRQGGIEPDKNLKGQTAIDLRNLLVSLGTTLPANFEADAQETRNGHPARQLPLRALVEAWSLGTRSLVENNVAPRKYSHSFSTSPE
jgi:hypothetical protein